MFDTFKRITNVSLIPIKGMELERNYSPFENELNYTIIRLQIILEMLPYLGFSVQKMDFFFHYSCLSDSYTSAIFYQKKKLLTSIDGKFYADVKNGVAFEF